MTGVTGVTKKGKPDTRSRHEAGEVISGHKCVYLHTDGKVYLADAEAGEETYGVIQSAVSSGDIVTVYLDGAKVNGFAGLTPGARYFNGTGGALSLDPPSTGMAQGVGIAEDVDTIKVGIELPIVL